MKNGEMIMVTGGAGQIGTELIASLRKKYGADRVLATDCRAEVPASLKDDGWFLQLDVMDKNNMEAAVKKYGITQIYHLAALLSATGEKNPQLCWQINIGGMLNALELGVQYKMDRLFIPSSIAVWGVGVPLESTPQETVLKPTTMYGVTKVAGELLIDYYFRKFGLDARGVRYPGIISAEALPGGGTTDYAVAIYYDAVAKGHYTCFVKESTRLPMMYMPDCLKAALDLMEAPVSNLKHHGDYNLASLSFTVKELADSIRKYIPNFTVDYAPDHRQAIADSWPDTVDDSCARKEWGWQPEWNLDMMTKDMLEKLGKRHKDGKLYPLNG